jgi:nucleotide-binding universal stress UspA family protein
MAYSKFLVPTDFSSDSLKALNVAFSQFATLDNTLILLHVVNSVESNELSNQRMHAVAHIDSKESVKKDHDKAQQAKLKELATPHLGEWKEIKTIVKKGNPSQCIADTVESEHVDLLIIGSHGAGGFRERLFGSTTYDVARKVKCSVIISKV